MMRDKVVVMRKWTETLKKRMSPAQYNEACARIIEYGIDSENYTESEDMMINFALDQIFVQMDEMSEIYADKVKKSGRPKNHDSKEVWEKANEGKSAQIIADELGIDREVVYKDEGWKNRKNEFYFDF